MGVIYTIYHTYSLMIMVNLGALMLCWKLPRRRFFWLIFISGIVLNIVFAWSWRYFFHNFFNSENIFLQCTTFLIQYIFTLLLVFLAFECKITTALFCTTCGYCLQHIVGRVTTMISQFFDGGLPTWISILIYIFLGIIVYIVSYRVFRMRNGKNNKGISIKSPIQIVIMAFALAVMVVVEQAMIPTVFGTERLLRVANFISSIIFVLCVLILQFNLLTNEEYRTELDVLKQISMKERQHFEMEKAVVDTINIKVHDLKHQLNVLDGKMDEREIGRIKSAVDIYDSSFRTGNKALDVVLTMKSLVCKSKHIELTVMLDGKKLAFISDTDIYSLFGNILDNAIEAVEKLDDEEKRVISLSMSEKKSMLFIRAENYTAVEPMLVEGIPQTTKEDKQYHGFGIKSIRMIVAQYGGDIRISVSGGVFTLDLMFFSGSSD